MDQLYIWSVGVGGRLGMLRSNWVIISRYAWEWAGGRLVGQAYVGQMR